MKMRTTKPSNNKFFITKSKGGYSTCIVGKPTDRNANVLSNCVGYACGRFNEIIGSMKYPQLNCNAENFIERAKTLGLKISAVPTLGGIMVWQKGTLSSNDGVGHVAVVEKIEGNTITTSESSYGGSPFYTVKRTNSNGRWGAGSSYKFRGCIINPAVKEPKYTTGTYVVTARLLNVRVGAGTNYRNKKYNELTNNARQQNKKLGNEKANGYLKGVVCTVTKIQGNWGLTLSGWICLDYCRKR